MIDRDEEKSFNTLRGFLRGEEPDEPVCFAYSATLRIHGDDLERPMRPATRKDIH